MDDMSGDADDESPCSSTSNLFDEIPHAVVDMMGNIQAAADSGAPPPFADESDVAAFVGEESGFSDPLGGDNFNANQFDIIQFINANQDDNDTPLDSPLDPSFYLNNCSMLNTQNNNNVCGHQQQMNGHNGHIQTHQNHHNNGLMAQHYGISGHMARGGQTRLPDSPPITDISAAASSVGASSASPSSGSDSPFSPDAYRNYNGLILNGQPIQSGVLTMHMPQQSHDQMLVGMHQNGSNQRNIIQQQSPQSEFLSPYPPSQSTPGSHSGSQVSPPALTQRGSNGSVCSSGSAGSGNCHYGMLGQQQQNDFGLDLYNQAMGQPHSSSKRRRINTNENSTTGAPILPNVKCEINPNMQQNRPSPIQTSQQRQFGCQVQQNNNGQHVPPRRRPPPTPSQLSCEEYSDDMNSSRTIKFTSFMSEQWSPLYDSAQRQLPLLNMAVVADKGFNFNAKENSFINQKKNHFQITSSITRNTSTDMPYFVRLPSGELQPIQEYMIAFCGVKQEMPTSEIPIKQSLPDRKTVPHEPVRFHLDATMPTKHTVPRLHFSETTLNNHRKSQKPNPEQRYFLLVVKLLACTPVGPVLVQAYQSDRIIVRASNPGQFEQPESDVAWQKGANGNVLTFNGQVAIGTDKPINDAQLTVHGNLVATGQITRPSDRRVKEDIAELDTKDAIARLAQMRIVEYSYKPEIAQQWGLSEENRHRVGVIAQELAEVLPDAVRDNGEFLTVDDTRIFYDTVAAAQELYRLTGNLECKIDQVEKISHKLARFAQKRKNHLGSMASGISDFSNLFGGTTLGGDNKSYISYSRTSLTSNGGNDSAPTKRNKGHRRCRSNSLSSSVYCHRGDQALCNSKLTQGTIVALVVVMALCLMAMCTLYVMDWYNRTYVYHPHYPYHSIVSATPQNDVPVGNIYEVKAPDLFKWSPPATIKAPPLAATCGLRTHCPAFCCASHLAYSTQDGENTTAADTFLALDDSDNALRAFVASVNDTAVVDPHSFKLQSGVNIEVVNLKANLDSRYCETKEACNARKGRYNLYVPMSDHLPTIPLQIKFTVEDGLFVDNCGSLVGFDHKQCEFDRNSGISTGHSPKPTSHRVSENVFEVSVGGFLKSAYRFRIGHTTESCRMNENQQGRSFDEYNLVFYRTCLVKRSSQSTPEASSHA